MTALMLALFGSVAGLLPGPGMEAWAPIRPVAWTGVGVGHPSQPALDAEAAKFAEAWSSSDTEFLSGVLAPEGIRLHLPEEEHLLIRPRQARAALDAFLGRHGHGEARVSRVSLAGGSREKGFAEILWTTSSPGLPEPVIFTLFVGYSLEEDGWNVTEIRVLF